MRLLRAKGFTVVVSRTENETVIRPQPDDVSDGLFTVQGVHDDVAARDVCANIAKAKVLVGIYFDAGGSPDDAGSVTGYDNARWFSAQNLRLATLVQDDVLGAMNAQGWGIPDLGVSNDSELGGPALSTAAAAYGHLMLLGPADPGFFTTPSQMPGALIEPLFLTDPYEGSLAASQSGQQVIAGALAHAVEQYFAPPASKPNARKVHPLIAP
jgi:N-acetylmuramoyl-L-alanine amidase